MSPKSLGTPMSTMVLLPLHGVPDEVEGATRSAGCVGKGVNRDSPPIGGIKG